MHYCALIPFLFLLLNLFTYLIGGQLIYNVVLVLGIHQNDLVAHSHKSIFFSDSFPLLVITKYWVELPVLYSRSLLVMYFICSRRRRGRQRMRWLDGITNLMDVSLSKLWEYGDGQGGLVCCDSWGHKESDMTEWLNWELSVFMVLSNS